MFFCSFLLIHLTFQLQNKRSEKQSPLTHQASISATNGKMPFQSQQNKVILLINKNMYRRDQEPRPRFNNSQCYSEISSPTYGMAKSKYLQKKLTFPEKLEKQRYFGEKKITTCTTTPTSEPLSFSGNSFHKKKKSNLREATLKSSESQFSHSSNINESTFTNYLPPHYQKLQEQNQQLRSQHKLLISHLMETKKSLQNVNKLYGQKCEQTQTLKSIISSLKEYIYHQRAQQIENQVYSRYVLHDSKPASKENNASYDRRGHSKIDRISINNALRQSPYLLRVNEQDINTFDSYIRQKCCQSIKGSAFEIFDSTQMF